MERSFMGMDGNEAPSTNLQAPVNIQIPSSNFETPVAFQLIM
jgi:hypothetical protein